MHSTRSSVTAGLNGAVLSAAAAVLLGLMVTVTALLTGGHVSLPGLIEATGGTTNGAASVEFTLGWTVLAAASVAGAAFEARRARGRVPIEPDRLAEGHLMKLATDTRHLLRIPLAFIALGAVTAAGGWMWNIVQCCEGGANIGAGMIWLVGLTLLASGALWGLVTVLATTGDRG